MEFWKWLFTHEMQNLCLHFFFEGILDQSNLLDDEKTAILVFLVITSNAILVVNGLPTIPVAAVQVVQAVTGRQAP